MNGNGHHKIIDTPAKYRTGSKLSKNGKFPGTVPDKLKPHNVEAEEALLGSVLINPDTVIYTASLKIDAGDFFIERHGWIWEVCRDLVNGNGPADLVTVTDELSRRGQLEEVGGAAYLSELINSVPSATWAVDYAKIVKRTSVLRQLIAGAGHISQLAFQDDLEASEAVELAMDILLDISKRNMRDTHRSMSDLGNQFLDHMERVRNSANGITGLPTGLIDLDRLLKGLQKSDLIILAGRPGMGKSALALQMCLETARNYQARSLFFTREMSDDSLFQRMVSYESGIDVQRLRTGQIQDDEYEVMVGAADRLAVFPITIDGDAATVEEIRARSIIEKEKNGLDLLVVDYIQRVQTGGKYQSKTAEIGDISGKLKGLAKDLNVPVLAISSLSRQCEYRSDKRPHLSDLRESGDIEYDADVVMFLYRDEVYNPETEFPNVAEISIEKHRQGPIGTLSVYFKKQLTKFLDLEIHKQSLDWVK